MKILQKIRYLKTDAINIVRCQACKQKYPRKEYTIHRDPSTPICDYCAQHLYKDVPKTKVIESKQLVCAYCGHLMLKAKGIPTIKGIDVSQVCKECRKMLKRVL